MSEIKIINDFYLLLKWYGNLLSRFPRNHRYGLGVRIENTLYDILDLMLEAKMSAEKRQFLYKTSIKLEQLRFLVRLTFDLKLITPNQHHAFTEQIDNVGKQLGGWLKSTQ